MLNKRHFATTAFAAGLVCMCWSATAAADNKMSLAFSDMTGGGYSSTQGATAYNGTLRSGVDFGSGRIVSGISRGRVSLINFTPPQANVGCGGIDYHLGGISWVNWDQFKELLDSVLLSAQYAVVNLALEWISEKLGASFKAVMNALQEATRFEVDSCKLGKSIVDKAVQIGGVSSSDFDAAVCGREASDAGQTESESDGGNWCTNFQRRSEQAANWINNARAWMNNGFTSPDGTKPTKGVDDSGSKPPPALCIGNCTWQTLVASGFVPIIKTATNTTSATADTNPEVYNAFSGTAFGELLMSGSGYRLGVGGAAQSGIAADAARPDNEAGPRAPTLTPGQFMAIFMCGTDYMQAATEDDLVAQNKAKADEAGNPQLTDAVVQATTKDIKGVCESLRKIGATGTKSETLKVYTCVTSTVASQYAKAEGDFSGVNDAIAATGDVSNDNNGWKTAKDTCAFVAPIDLKVWANQDYVKRTLLGEGLLNRNFRIMQSIMIKLIKGNEALTTDVEIPWMNAAPTPVYQMLSMASLFPIQGINIVNSQAMLITVMQAQALLDRQVADAARNVDPLVPLFPEDFAKITDFLGLATRTSGRVNVDIDQQLQRMTAFQAQVKTMQTAVMDSIYGRQLLGNMDFTADIATVAPTTP